MVGRPGRTRLRAGDVSITQGKAGNQTKDETLNLGLDDLSQAHKLAIRRVKANGLHLDRELKPYLQCIVGEIANAFSEGRHYQYKVDRTQMCEDRTVEKVTDEPTTHL